MVTLCHRGPRSALKAAIVADRSLKLFAIVPPRTPAELCTSNSPSKSILAVLIGTPAFIKDANILNRSADPDCGYDTALEVAFIFLRDSTASSVSSA